jgi:valyl-tRNA synthetase
VLGHVFDVLLRLLHPLVPFVTERLWTALTRRESVVIADWPTPDAAARDEQAERDMGRLQELVTEVRRFRSEQQIKPGVRLPAVLVPDAGSAAAELERHVPQVAALARLADLRVGDGVPDGWQEVVVAGTRVALDLSGTVDVRAERARLRKAIELATAEESSVAAKLANPSFAERAPAPVVEKTRTRQSEARAEIDRLTALLDALPAQ